MKIIHVTEDHKVIEYPDSIVGVFIRPESKLVEILIPFDLTSDSAIYEDVSKLVVDSIKKLKS